MNTASSPLRLLIRRLASLGAVVLAGAAAVLVFSPTLLIPTRPFSRWGLVLLSTIVLAGVIEAFYRPFWSDVHEITQSREPGWLKAVAIGLGLVLSIGGLALAFGLDRLLSQ